MKWLRKILGLRCKHRFKLEDVVKLSIDPKCIHCGQLLSELEKKHYEIS